METQKVADSNTVEVLEQVDNEYRLRKSTWDRELQLGAYAPVRIILGSSKELEASTVVQQNDGPGSTIPSEFWTAAVKDLNGGFGSRYNHDATGNVVSNDTWCWFKIKQVSTDSTLPSISYCWQQVAIFVKWQLATHSELILFLDSPHDLQTRLQRRLPSIDQSDPYAWHAAFVDEIKKLYNTSVWSLRDLVRDAEVTRGTTHYFQPDFTRLHDVARHIIHSNETLDIAVDTVDSIIHEHILFTNECRDSGAENSFSFKQVQRCLYTLSKELNGIKRRSVSLNERLQNEINFAFNIVSQRSSRMAVQISENARSDNGIMKTIAIVGLLYLPGTFVSGLFGMNFFQFNRNIESGVQTWTVSEKFWLYWAITGPLTIATALIWATGHYWHPVKQQFTSLWAYQWRKRSFTGKI